MKVVFAASLAAMGPLAEGLMPALPRRRSGPSPLRFSPTDVAMSAVVEGGGHGPAGLWAGYLALLETHPLTTKVCQEEGSLFDHVTDGDSETTHL